MLHRHTMEQDTVNLINAMATNVLEILEFAVKGKAINFDDERLIRAFVTEKNIKVMQFLVQSGFNINAQNALQKY